MDPSTCWLVPLTGMFDISHPHAAKLFLNPDTESRPELVAVGRPELVAVGRPEPVTSDPSCRFRNVYE